MADQDNEDRAAILARRRAFLLTMASGLLLSSTEGCEEIPPFKQWREERERAEEVARQEALARAQACLSIDTNAARDRLLAEQAALLNARRADAALRHEPSVPQACLRMSAAQSTQSALEALANNAEFQALVGGADAGSHRGRNDGGHR